MSASLLKAGGESVKACICMGATRLTQLLRHGRVLKEKTKSPSGKPSPNRLTTMLGVDDSEFYGDGEVRCIVFPPPTGARAMLTMMPCNRTWTVLPRILTRPKYLGHGTSATMWTLQIFLTTPWRTLLFQRNSMNTNLSLYSR